MKKLEEYKSMSDFVLIILPLIAVAIAVVLLVNDTKKKNEKNFRFIWSI